MAPGLSSNVGRIINFPGRGKNDGGAELLKVVLPIAVALAWRLLEARQGAVEKAAGGVQEKTARAAGKVKEAAGKKAAEAGKSARKGRRSTRYYAITALIAGLENPATRKLIISGLKLARNVL